MRCTPRRGVARIGAAREEIRRRAPRSKMGAAGEKALAFIEHVAAAAEPAADAAAYAADTAAQAAETTAGPADSAADAAPDTAGDAMAADTDAKPAGRCRANEGDQHCRRDAGAQGCNEFGIRRGHDTSSSRLTSLHDQPLVGFVGCRTFKLAASQPCEMNC